MIGVKISKAIGVGGSLILGVGLSAFGFYSYFARDDFIITLESPQGMYRLVFEGKTTPTDTIAGSSEMVKLTVFKGKTVYFVKDPFFGEKGLDLHFRGAYPSREWFGESALRLGGDLSSQPFRDEIIVFNATREKLPVVELFYGKHQRFILFDLEAQEKVQLFASPQFGLSAPPAATVIYAAIHPTTNRHIQGRVEGLQRRSPSEGPLGTTVTIRDD